MAEMLGISVSFFTSLRHYHPTRISGFTCGFQANRVEHHDIDKIKKKKKKTSNPTQDWNTHTVCLPLETCHGHSRSGLTSTMNLLAPDDTVRSLHSDPFHSLFALVHYLVQRPSATLTASISTSKLCQMRASPSLLQS